MTTFTAGQDQTAKKLLSFLKNKNKSNVFLVVGSPASGKTTYVKEHKGPNDLVLDLDYICAALSGEVGNVHLDHRAVLQNALDVRDLLYGCIQSRRGKWDRAYVITTLADARKINALADRLGAEVISMDTTLDECIRRIQSDPSRENSRELNEKLARDWFAEHNRSICGTETGISDRVSAAAPADLVIE